MKSPILLAIGSAVLLLTLGRMSAVSAAEDDQVAKGRVESCSGCSLNRLHEVKQFIFEDLPLYHNVEFKSIGGAKPELILLNEKGDELERIALSKLNRAECNQLLLKKGFYKKASSEDQVPEEYQSGPYVPREDL